MLFSPTNVNKYVQCTKSTKPLSIRSLNFQIEFENQLDQSVKIINASYPPWLIEKPNCISELLNFNKKTTSPCMYVQAFYNISSKFANYSLIFTDRFKFVNKVGCAFKIEESERNFKLSSVTNIYTTEIKAIELVISTLSHHPNNIL